MRESLLHSYQHAVVLGLDARLEVLYQVRPTNHGIEDLPNGAPDNEVCAVVVQIISSYDNRVAQLTLETNVHLLNHRVLHAIVDNVDTAGSRAGKNEPRKRTGERRRTW